MKRIIILAVLIVIMAGAVVALAGDMGQEQVTILFKAGPNALPVNGAKPLIDGEVFLPSLESWHRVETTRLAASHMMKAMESAPGILSVTMDDQEALSVLHPHPPKVDYWAGCDPSLEDVDFGLSCDTPRIDPGYAICSGATGLCDFFVNWQKHLENLGFWTQSPTTPPPPSSHGADIGAYFAWWHLYDEDPAKVWGDPNVKIALIDTNIDFKHRDLQGTFNVVIPPDCNQDGEGPADCLDNYDLTGHGGMMIGLMAANAYLTADEYTEYCYEVDQGEPSCTRTTMTVGVWDVWATS